MLEILRACGSFPTPYTSLKLDRQPLSPESKSSPHRSMLFFLHHTFNIVPPTTCLINNRTSPETSFKRVSPWTYGLLTLSCMMHLKAQMHSLSPPDMSPSSPKSQTETNLQRQWGLSSDPRSFRLAAHRLYSSSKTPSDPLQALLSSNIAISLGVESPNSLFSFSISVSSASVSLGSS